MQTNNKKPASALLRQFIFLVLTVLLTQSLHSQAVVEIHYLGHSSFALEFDNGISIVTDYGHYNAWVDGGWDSPIYDFGDLVPDVMTYSHTNHEDHYDPDRIPNGVSYILTEFDTLEIDGIHIRPIRTCEGSINTESNSSYIFTYKDLKICHLGDAQAQIINIENEEVKNHIADIFSESYDLLFMTIDGTEPFVKQVELFVDLLQPSRAILMHNWTETNMKNVLRHFELKSMLGKSYHVRETGGPKYTLSSEQAITPVQIITLQPAQYSVGTKLEGVGNYTTKFYLSQNYPNPFNPRTIINYELPMTNDVQLNIYNMLGQKVTVLVSGKQSAGRHQVEWNAEDYPSGLYYYVLQAGRFREVKQMVLLK
jgi:L-ascorbate metabolism protein UlaG (beta-lactamase superfamily)